MGPRINGVESLIPKAINDSEPKLPQYSPDFNCYTQLDYAQLACCYWQEA